ncbi:MAG: alpha/beta hydrolase [Bacteroidota bacterium]
MLSKPLSGHRIYCIPGLGTDRRIFHELNMPIPMQFLYWLSPLPSESLSSYASRMWEQIEHPNPIILGVSFGGIIAQEMATLQAVKALILVSSLRHQRELPLQLRIMKYLPLYYLSKGEWRIESLPVWAPAYGVKKSEEQQLLQVIFRSMDDAYRMWGIHQLISWKGQDISCPILRLHGTEDRLFPIRPIHDAIPISGGTHFMIAQKAEIIGDKILAFIRTLR